MVSFPIAWGRHAVERRALLVDIRGLLQYLSSWGRLQWRLVSIATCRYETMIILRPNMNEEQR